MIKTFVQKCCIRKTGNKVTIMKFLNTLNKWSGKIIDPKIVIKELAELGFQRKMLLIDNTYTMCFDGISLKLDIDYRSYVHLSLSKEPLRVAS